ncbi:glycosyltransferase [Luteimicrobium subarcticum]|uniref:glycosyltransferase n=1 Tax=Luteimicrobium subarcticum TaxID=620910 RepID=UPI000C232FE7|nr:glycosyltransferase [Luteimicrobium subarcticum]
MPGRVVAFGTYDTSRHPRVGILVDGLRARGVDVSELDRPLGLSTAERVRMLTQPWRLPALAGRLAARWWSLARDARADRRAHGTPDVVLVGYLGHFDVLLARALFRRSYRVLDHLVFAGDTARDRGAGGLKARLLTGLDRAALAACDLAVVDTDEHLAMLPARTAGVVVPVGATDDWFAAGDASSRAPSAVPSEAPAAAPLSVVFFGLFTPLQGAPTIASGLADLLRERPDVRVTLAGTGQDLDAARATLTAVPAAATQVTWLDWVEPADLPALVASHDVCLGILGDTPKALRVVPNKVYQGLAAGCAVVTSGTPPQRRALADAAVLVPPGDAAALAAALRALADDPAALADARTRARTGGRRFTPDAVVAPLLEALRVAGHAPTAQQVPPHVPQPAEDAS